MIVWRAAEGRSGARPRSGRSGRLHMLAHRPADQVACRAFRQFAQFAGAAQAGGAALGGDVQDVECCYPAGSEALAAEEQRRAGFKPERGRVGRGRAVATQANGDARLPEVAHGGDAATSDEHCMSFGQCATPTPAAPSRTISSGEG
jgi:hypothetical protein